MGKTSYNFKMNFYKLLTLCICGYPLTNEYGVMGASLCYLLLSITGLVVWKFEIYKLLRVTVGDIMRLILLPLMCTLIPVMVVLCLDLTSFISSVGVFVASLGLGLTVYLFSGLVIERLAGVSFLKDLIGILRLLKPAYEIKRDNV